MRDGNIAMRALLRDIQSAAVLILHHPAREAAAKQTRLQRFDIDGRSHIFKFAVTDFTPKRC